MASQKIKICLHLPQSIATSSSKEHWALSLCAPGSIQAGVTEPKENHKRLSRVKEGTESGRWTPSPSSPHSNPTAHPRLLNPFTLLWALLFSNSKFTTLYLYFYISISTSISIYLTTLVQFSIYSHIQISDMNHVQLYPLAFLALTPLILQPWKFEMFPGIFANSQGIILLIFPLSWNWPVFPDKACLKWNNYTENTWKWDE